MNPLGTDIERDVSRSMFDTIPRDYGELEESKQLLESEAIEMELLHDRISDTLDQFYIETASWGIASWEVEVGITVNPLKPLEERRSAVKAKLRGAGTTTKELIENVAEAYSNGDVEVVENNATYSVVIKFVGTLGVPSNIPDLEKALREIIPAHLTYTLEYTYVTYSEVASIYASYDALAASGLTYPDLLTTA
jgi:hypothetical protein